MPTITDIDLNRNHISDVSVLRKVNWPHFETIILVDNWVKEGTFFTFLQSSQVMSVNLGKRGSHQVEDMKWVGKMLSTKLSSEGFRHKKKIKWGKLEGSLRKKYRYI